MTIKSKILFLSPDTGDYLNISLLHGLKSLPDVEVVDYPKSYVSYKKYREELIGRVRGNGFTLFFNLEEDQVNRFHLKFNELANNEFDLVIFGDIQSSFGYYFEYYNLLKKGKTVFLDGSDAPNLFGDNGFFWRNYFYWFIPKPQKKFLYFKRELIPSEINHSRFLKILPRFITRKLSVSKNIREISFSIPEDKIIKKLPSKIKKFTSHIVDKEVAAHISSSQTNYAFKNEADYYLDIQQSEYGITTKRAGWDCLRHYEIAANGAVICFRDLHLKPIKCAPHGLIDGVNCVSYSSYEELVLKIDQIDADKYRYLQEKSLQWVREHSTISVAKKFLKDCNMI